MTASSPFSRAPSSARGWASPSTSRRARTPLNRDGTQVHPRQKRSSSGTTKSAGTLGFRLAIAPSSMACRSACWTPTSEARIQGTQPKWMPPSESLSVAWSPRVRTGSGGSHFYFVMDGKNLPTKTLVLRQSKDEVEWQEDGKTKNGPAWKIEFLWAGHACTLPPSIHPDTGKPYAWVNGGLSKVGPPPDTLLKALQAAEPTNNPSPGDWPKREPIVGELKPVSRSIQFCFLRRCSLGSWTKPGC